ncbi:uncharacterized protein [Apostichopus japonicus]|uniref:uncharacterized protein n=1 Tax=Stichopus japonicus TaxID=307972 RepID=UPI003AB5DD7B
MADHESCSKNACFAHCYGVSGILKPFTVTTWNTLLKSVTLWKDLVGYQADIASEFLRVNGDVDITTLPIPEHGGIHEKCYRYFTDSSKRKRGINNKKKDIVVESCNEPELEPSTSSGEPKAKDTSSTAETRLLRSSSSVVSFRKILSNPVLPEVCIICCGNKSWRDREGRKKKEPLLLCELPDGGKLAIAANDKKDIRILIQIRERDCVAIKVRYHRSCFKGYTNYLTRNNAAPKEQMYAKGFDAFCKYNIDQKIIVEKNIYLFTKLKKQFCKAVKDVEGIDASGYKTYNLKQRLQRRYPQLCFLKPKKIYASEMVYIETLSTEEIVPGVMGSESDTTTTDTDTTDHEKEVPPKRQRHGSGYQTRPNEMSSLRDRYSTALDLKKEMLQGTASTNLPWPPTSTDLSIFAARSMVPTKLYNFLAWVVGISDEPDDKEKVKTTDAEDRHILAIAQDIMYLATKGMT